MKKRDSKTNLLDHSQAKVRLLGEYLKRYLNIITNNDYVKGVKIYDLFCGAGVYKNEGEGSPLIILRTVKDVHFSNVAKKTKFPPIDCYFNDLNQAKVEGLKGLIQSKSLYYPDYGGLNFSSKDYLSIVGDLSKEINTLKGQKAFVFIDPYGYKNIKAAHIKDLLSGGKAEVLLFLPTQFMYRFDTKGTPEALKDFIEELVPYKEWLETDSVWKFIAQLKEGFRNYLPGTFVDTFTIKKDENTVFCLFFFSPHIKGFEKMLEAKWDIDTEQGIGWEYNDTGSLFASQKTNPLEEKLNAFLLDEKRNNQQVYEFTLRSGFLPKHTTEVFSSWQKSGKLDVNLLDGTLARKGAFYISYDYFKNGVNPKVLFKLN